MLLKLDILDPAFDEMNDSILLHGIPEKSVFIGNGIICHDESWDVIDMF